ncbi:hypothetical protein VC69_gp048 [Mycobacterium phage Inventum]|uniref:Uncharacterized protein n=1 Tax=Mycobacterium phage Inventum TaxID=1527580 RepID=A0A076YHE9_9CAUD|nr:hypothetical protein VC69_gp048 [Mycobacterium phage Inventum]AIK67663.1 hypothetical protein PBI_INVENTUM_48 [Mycobacterium phage Inventum]QWY82542.1 hypothetical protein SEA_SASSAFRAS_51 [Mycobacterium phage Sassafras]
MNLVERLNARFNNAIHDGLALVGAVVDPWLARLGRQAMNNALGRDIGLDYGDCLAAVEAEVEVHEPAPCVCGHLREDHYRVGGFIDPCSKCDCLDLLYESSAERWVSADPSPTPVGDIGPGAGMVPPPPAPGPSNPLNTYVAGPLGEAIPGDEFMELGEFLDTATLEELAAIRQRTEVSRADLELHLRWYTTARVSPEVVAQSLLDSYRITPR